MEAATTGLEVYEKAGVAALFIVMYLTTVWFLIRLLIKDRQKEIDRTEKLTQVIIGVTQTLKEVVAVNDKLKTSVAEKDNRLAEFLAYIKARDEARRNGRNDSRRG